MDFLKRLKRLRKRNLLILSAASLHSGVQFLYLRTEKRQWTVIEYQVSPYLQKIRTHIEDLLHERNRGPFLKEVAWLDYQFSVFLLDSTRSFLSLLPRHAQKPDLIALNRFSLWNDSVEEGAESKWNLPLGDAQVMASALRVPILTDFMRHDLLKNGEGALPVGQGDKRLAQTIGRTTVFINIGILSQVTIINENNLIDSHCGPGTCLINLAAKETGADEGFDRDGSLAQSGTVDTDCLENLASSDWFNLPAPKHAKTDFFDSLYREECLQRLKPLDRLATVTALTARTISNFYKQEIKNLTPPKTIYISGGGVNNSMLTELLEAYLVPVKVKSVEELNIPVEGRIPLALGLTIDTYLHTRSALKKQLDTKNTIPLGKWVFP